MKTPVAVALIVMGALLAMMPAFADAWYQYLHADMLKQPGLSNIAVLVKQMDYLTRLIYWMAGGGMIITSTYCSLFMKSAVREATAPQTSPLLG